AAAVRGQPRGRRGELHRAAEGADPRRQAAPGAGGVRRGHAPRAVAVPGARRDFAVHHRVGDLPPAGDRMSERARRLLWGAFLVLLGVGLWIAYQRFVLSAGPIKWTRDGTTYELLDPRTLGVVL